GVAAGAAGVLPEHGGAAFARPAQDGVGPRVHEEQRLLPRVPHRPFREPVAGGDALGLRRGVDKLVEARVQRNVARRHQDCFVLSSQSSVRPATPPRPANAPKLPTQAQPSWKLSVAPRVGTMYIFVAIYFCR